MSESKHRSLLIAVFAISLVLTITGLVIANRAGQEIPSPKTTTKPANQATETNSDEQTDNTQTTDPNEKLGPAAGGWLIFSGDEFNRLFEQIELDNLVWPQQPPTITDDPEVDQQIRQIATERGYQLRPMPADISQLVTVEADRHRLQPAAALAYEELKAAAAAEGLAIWLVSAYRSYDYQRPLFLQEVPDPTDKKSVSERLKLVAIPGYSKHHTGYAIDIAEGNLIFGDFASSASYAWLSANNYENAKKYGWIPSYPPDANKQGPEPESWEFTYVGKQYLVAPNQITF